MLVVEQDRADGVVLVLGDDRRPDRFRALQHDAAVLHQPDVARADEDALERGRVPALRAARGRYARMGPLLADRVQALAGDHPLHGVLDHGGLVLDDLDADIFAVDHVAVGVPDRPLVSERACAADPLAASKRLLLLPAHALADVLGLTRVVSSEDAGDPAARRSVQVEARRCDVLELGAVALGQLDLALVLAWPAGQPARRVGDDLVDAAVFGVGQHPLVVRARLLRAGRCADVVVLVEVNHRVAFAHSDLPAVLLLAFDTQFAAFAVVADPNIDPNRFAHGDHRSSDG